MRAFACGKKRHGQTKRMNYSKSEGKSSERSSERQCGDKIIKKRICAEKEKIR